MTSVKPLLPMRRNFEKGKAAYRKLVLRGVFEGKDRECLINEARTHNPFISGRNQKAWHVGFVSAGSKDFPE